MNAQRALPIAMLICAIYLAITSMIPEHPALDYSSRLYPTQSLPFVSPAYASEQLPPESRAPLEPATLPPVLEPLATAESPAAPEPPALDLAPLPEAPPEAPPEIIPLVTDFYPDVALEQAAIEASRDLPTLMCPCGVTAPQEYVPMTELQRQQSRQRTR